VVTENVAGGNVGREEGTEREIEGVNGTQTIDVGDECVTEIEGVNGTQAIDVGDVGAAEIEGVHGTQAIDVSEE
jgi:hypothetical protein